MMAFLSTGLFPFYTDAVCREISKVAGPDSYVIDLGSGYQPYRSLIKGRYTGVDLFVPADIKHDLNKPLTFFERECCEVVLSLSVINYLDNQQEHVNEAHRILKPGGIFLLGSPNFANHEHNRVTLFHLLTWAKRAGFQTSLVAPICYLNPKSNMFIICKKSEVK